jgi:hypothetical protein
LTAALKAAGLVDALQGKGPFTVFAPTDKAFKRLPKGTLENLLKPENRKLLTGILTYHVVPGNVKAEQVVKLKKAKTLNGQQVSIAVTKKGVKVNNAKVVKTDIETSNGVIHVINRVLIPSRDQAGVKNKIRHTIVNAINHGSGLYNAGHHKACADLYMKTAEKIMTSAGGSVCNSVMNRLETAVNTSRKTTCNNTRAWTLRHALDATLASVSE